jgi:hypothetical protein
MGESEWGGGGRGRGGVLNKMNKICGEMNKMGIFAWG